MMKIIWNVVKAIGTLWAFFSALAVILDLSGVLPYYDIYYRKKIDITPMVMQYPGQNVRLCADFARSVESKDIERIVWDLKDSSGNKYADLPNLRDIDLTLVPDFSGTVNVEVKAKLYQEDDERYGRGSIYIVQTKPHKLTRIEDGTFVLSWDLEKVDLKSVQLYEGSANWAPATAAIAGAGTVRFTMEDRSFPVWNGKAYLRYKPSGDPTGSYQYEAAMALNEKAQWQQ